MCVCEYVSVCVCSVPFEYDLCARPSRQPLSVCSPQPNARLSGSLPERSWLITPIPDCQSFHLMCKAKRVYRISQCLRMDELSKLPTRGPYLTNIRAEAQRGRRVLRTCNKTVPRLGPKSRLSCGFLPLALAALEWAVLSLHPMQAQITICVFTQHKQSLAMRL